MSELKPCPFCGGKAEIIEIEPHTHMIYGINNVDCEGEAFVECTCCGAAIAARTAEEVIVAWNRRADEKLGKWEEDVDGAYICSACGCYDYEASKYCPNCGAKMEAENDDK